MGYFDLPRVGVGTYGTGYAQATQLGPPTARALRHLAPEPEITEEDLPAPQLTQPDDAPPALNATDPSILRRASDLMIGGVVALGNLLDLPHSMLRDVSTWMPGGIPAQNPFDQLLTPFTDANRVSGQDLLVSGGVIGDNEDAGTAKHIGRWASGAALEIFTDPLTYATFGAKAALTRAGQLTRDSGHLEMATRLAQSKTGRHVGPREANQLVTGRELLKSLDEPRLGAVLDTYSGPKFANKPIKSIDEIPDALLDQKLGGNIRFKFPFMDDIVLSDLPMGLGKGPQIARARDKAAEAIRFSPPVRWTGAALAPVLRGFKEKFNQIAAGKISRSEEEASIAATEAIAPYIEMFADQGWLGTGDRADALRRSNDLYDVLEGITGEVPDYFRTTAKAAQHADEIPENVKGARELLETIDRSGGVPVIITRRLRDAAESVGVTIDPSDIARDVVEKIRRSVEASEEAASIASGDPTAVLHQFRQINDTILSDSDQLGMGLRGLGDTGIKVDLKDSLDFIPADHPLRAMLKEGETVFEFPSPIRYMNRERQYVNGKAFARDHGRRVSQKDPFNIKRADDTRHVTTSDLNTMSVDQEFAGILDRGIAGPIKRLKDAYWGRPDTGVMGSTPVTKDLKEEMYNKFKAKYPPMRRMREKFPELFQGPPAGASDEAMEAWSGLMKNIEAEFDKRHRALFDRISRLDRDQVLKRVPMYHENPAEAMMTRLNAALTQQARVLGTRRMMGQMSRVRQDSQYAEGVTDASYRRFADEVREVFGEQGEEFLLIHRAQAESWARQHNRSPDEFFRGLQVQSRVEPGMAFDPKSTDTLEQGARTSANEIPGRPTLPGFFSKMANTVEEKVQGNMGWEQFRATMKKAGVKDEELADVRMQEFFKDGTRSRQEIQNYIEQNKVNLRIVTASERSQAFGLNTPPGGIEGTYREIVVEAPSVPGFIPDTPHFSPETLFHMRLHDVELPSGGRGLRIEEIQSDALQAGRKVGFRDTPGVSSSQPHKDAPLKKNWRLLAMKEVLRESAEKGYDEVLLVSGRDIRRAVGGPKSLEGFYDDTLFSDLKRYTKKWGSFQGKKQVVPEIEEYRNLHEEFNKVSEAASKKARNLEDVIAQRHPESGLAQDAIEDAVFELRYGNRQLMDQLPDKIRNDPKVKSLVKSLDKITNDSNRLADRMGSLEDAHGREFFRYDGEAQSFKITEDMRRSLLADGQPLYQPGARGQVQFFADGKAIITAFKGADISTLVHESAHVFRRNLGEDLLRQAEAALKVKDGNWTREAEEAFAEGFEKYLADGVAPTPGLREVFKQFRDWLVDLYRAIAGSPLEKEVSPQLKKVFDAMLDKDRIAAPMKHGDTVKTSLDGLSQRFPAVGRLMKEAPLTDVEAEAAKMGRSTDRLNLDNLLDDMEGGWAENKKAIVESIGDEGVDIGNRISAEKQMRHAEQLAKRLRDHPELNYSAEDLADMMRDPETVLHLRGELEQLKQWEGFESAMRQMESMFTPDGRMKEGMQATPSEILEHFDVDSKLGADWLRMNRKASASEEENAFWHAYDVFTSFWKGNVTAPFPSFHVRNAFGGIVQNALNGAFDPTAPYGQRYAKPYTDTLRLLRSQQIEDITDIPYFRRRGLSKEDAQKELRHMILSRKLIASPGEHVDITSMNTGRVADQIIGRKTLKERFATPPGTTWQQRWNPLNVGPIVGEDIWTPMRIGREVGDVTEILLRVSPFIAFLRQGIDPDEAARLVKHLQVDYSSLTPFERQRIRRAVPFYTFTKGMTQYLGQQMRDRPFGPVGAMFRAQQSAAGNDPGAPEYIRNKFNVPLRTDPDGTKHYFVGADLMHEPPAELIGTSIGDTMFNMAGMLHPALKFPIERMTNASLFQEGPYGGGRSLDSLDPLLGRTLSNIGQTLGIRESDQPVRLFDSTMPEHVVANLPVSRYLSEVRKLTDPRKTALDRAVNFLTGARITSVSPESQDALLREQVSNLMLDAGGRPWSNIFMPQSVLDTLDESELARVEQYKQLLSSINRRQKFRSKKKEEEEAAEAVQ